MTRTPVRLASAPPQEDHDDSQRRIAQQRIVSVLSLTNNVVRAKGACLVIEWKANTDSIIIAATKKSSLTRSRRWIAKPVAVYAVDEIFQPRRRDYSIDNKRNFRHRDNRENDAKWLTAVCCWNEVGKKNGKQCQRIVSTIKRSVLFKRYFPAHHRHSGSIISLVWLTLNRLALLQKRGDAPRKRVDRNTYITFRSTSFGRKRVATNECTRSILYA